MGIATNIITETASFSLFPILDKMGFGARLKNINTTMGDKEVLIGNQKWVADFAGIISTEHNGIIYELSLRTTDNNPGSPYTDISNKILSSFIFTK